ncbi:hypothetical protein CBOM_07883 [Ceraceosorus bombacis]|uniref:Uncharacterized protein n=1 Tax=Ceraceosorus bombacis TaxID=401625 RepID=A0A0P1BIZ1_9BASI|nr:hypothetical protein CBOM_07883 [Ceraceosorus bombacis]
MHKSCPGKSPSYAPMAVALANTFQDWAGNRHSGPLNEAQLAGSGEDQPQQSYSTIPKGVLSDDNLDSGASYAPTHF